MESNEKTFGMLCHLSSLCAYIGIPFGSILGPLIFWLIKKDEMPLVDDQGKEALNFNITATIAAMICIPLIFIGIGFLLLPCVLIIHVVFTVIASVAASKGDAYRYPLTLRLIK